MKNGLYEKDGRLVYYKDGVPKHAGVVKIDGAIYYISSRGRAVKGQHVVHQDMANDILKRGTYTFGEDYKLVEGSYIAPKKHRKFRKLRNKIKALLKPKKKSNSPRKADLKYLRVLIPIGLLAALLLIEPLFSSINVKKSDQVLGSPQVQVELPAFEEDVLLCSKAAHMEYNGELTMKEAVETGNPYRPFLFEYQLEHTTGELHLKEQDNWHEPRTYVLSDSSTYVEIDNLKTDTTYYYEVIAGDETYTGSFHTAPGTRYVEIPGLVNTRDIGGYTTLDGKKVKQELLIRGVELDGMVNAPFFIPESELQNVQDTFDFAYDMDLRSPGIYNGPYTSRLNVPHAFYDAPMYGNIFTDTFRASLRNIFRDLADPEKYPMYLHCTWGRDRTGTIVFLLQGILNMSEEDMVREYHLSGYADKSIADNTHMQVIMSGLEPYEGDTLNEKIVSFLTGYIGVTEAEIESIRNIFLEG